MEREAWKFIPGESTPATLQTKMIRKMYTALVCEDKILQLPLKNAKKEKNQKEEK